MSNLLFNIRFGTRHLQITRDRPWLITFKHNPYWWEVKPEKWFQVYCAFGKQVF